MALVSASSSPERIDLPRSTAAIDASPSRFAPSPDMIASDPSPSSPNGSFSVGADTPGRDDRSSSSSNPNRDSDPPSLEALRSEEYRQLFRLPQEEFLVQDFNCAFQESILLQGHMYLFVHYICFYSNIFGFETKKIIPFHEVTSVKRAKTAGIFPNAIEIFAGGKKYFFASFLSRDEAFKLIHDGWLERGNSVEGTTDRQDSISESSSQENGLEIERVGSSKNMSNELDSNIRDEEPSVLIDSNLPESNQNEASPSQDNVEQHAETVAISEPSSSTMAWTWKPEDCHAPKISEDYTKVADAKFPIKVEEFFNLFFSDDAVDFAESFHKRCGDKEFRCTSWQPHDRFGYIRNVSFQHPIKIYFGAKFGSCQEMEKFCVYRNSNLVIKTSQEITDVPYGDYFTVEGLWDVQRDCNQSKEGCKLQVYVNVVFSKRTVWKGKIVQSTVEECREAYATWIEMAHELLKQKNLEKQEGTAPTDNMIQNTGVTSETEQKHQEHPERSEGRVEQIGTSWMSGRMDNQQAGNLLQGSLLNATSVGAFLRESAVKFCSFLRSQNRVTQVLVIAFAVILLMQVTILVLLNRPQHIHVASPVDYLASGPGRVTDRSAETMAWMEKRIQYLRDEMLMVESRLERMWHEHAVLKAQLKDWEQLRKQR